MIPLISSAFSYTTKPCSGHHVVISRPTHHRRIYTMTIQSSGKNQTPSSTSSTNKDFESDKNVLLKLAWYSSEVLGIATSFFRPPAEAKNRDMALAENRSRAVDRGQVMENIKEDFRQSYFITGNLTVDAYEEDCEFVDPAASFRGLRRFKRNCTNFGSLIVKSKMKLTKWEEFEDKGIGHWSFSCILFFPWRPILSATGYTEYYFDPESGRVCRHEEHWNVPKMALFKQMLRPGPRQNLFDQ